MQEHHPSLLHDDLPYRTGVGIMLLNAQGKVFVGQRCDSGSESRQWQMPQGGVDDGEGPEQAALRELEEETGISPRHVKILHQMPGNFAYDLPQELLGKIWKGRYRGQRQTWFVMRFLGQDSDVNIRTKHPEFRDWRWVDKGDLHDLIVPFKRNLYKEILAVFSELAI